MEKTIPKARRSETAQERSTRIQEANDKALVAALVTEDQIDAMIRRSIADHGA